MTPFKFDLKLFCKFNHFSTFSFMTFHRLIVKLIQGKVTKVSIILNGTFLDFFPTENTLMLFVYFLLRLNFLCISISQ